MGTFDNAGDIAPGMPDGDDRIATLTLKGALTEESTGFFSFDVGVNGLSDLLAVSGAVAFDGTVHVTGVDGYQARLGDRFRVIDFASFSGQLTDVQEFGFAPGVAFTAEYSADHLDLVVTQVAQAVPEPGTWALMLAGLGANVLLGRRRFMPGEFNRTR